jgi:hypothetical protein
MRLSDVIEKDIYLEPEYFSYYTVSHFDFLVTDGEAKPFMAIQYDGPYHRNDAETIVRDSKKNLLCKQAGIADTPDRCQSCAAKISGDDATSLDH